ncbi:MAG TPA: FlgO family outer membrane protein [Elusimicrobiales bacterium]|nr:FlgO family outer membrane protein [Elusimicrobiales bacterium]
MVSAILARVSDIPDGKIAVYDITDTDGRPSPEGRLVAERLTSRLTASGGVRVIERRRLEAALKELSLSAAGAVDEAGLARAGFLSGAGAVVTGTLTELNGGYELNARAVNVVTGDIISAATVPLQIDMREGPSAMRLPPARLPAHPAAEKEAPQAPPGWNLWPGRGKAFFRDGAIIYCTESRQLDNADKPRSGYYPGLLLEKEIAGKKWELEIMADYDMKGIGGQWFSVFVWLGKKGAHPHRPSPGGSLAVTASRQKDTGYHHDFFGFAYEPGGDMVRFGAEINSLRFERDGDLFTIYAGTDGKDYRKALSVFSPKGGAAESQRLVLGAQAFGDPGSCAVYRSIKLNGKPLF